MDWKKYVTQIQLDVTSYCNAKCVACSRNDADNDNNKQPWLPLQHLDIELWRKFVKESDGYDLRWLIFNGSWGDAGMHPLLPELIEIWAETHPNAHVEIATNGGTHNAEWWKKLGTYSRKYLKNHDVKFAIEGVNNESHSTYRRSTSFDKIIENAKAFIDAGGWATWIMTVFDHNYEEIPQARQMAKDLGFTVFEIRESFIKHAHVTQNGKTWHVTAKDVPDEIFSGKSLFYGNSSEEFDTDALNNVNKDNDWKHSKELPSHQCHWYTEGKLQIDPWGNVWPCCHTSDSSINPIEKPEGVLKYIDEPGFNNLNDHSFEEILSHPWYVEHLDKIVNRADMRICQEMCRVKKII